ncbi:MAG: efflux RND transporter periplasmic adaptor subunit [Chitinophagaceae bacterium]
MQAWNFSSFIKIGLVFCVLFFSCKSKKDPPLKKDNAPVIVDVIVAQPTTIKNTLEANGTVVANEYVELHPEISGRITYLNVPEGSYIQQGTLLARINDADLRATLNKSQVALDLAQQTEQRLRTLLNIKGVNQADYDAALNQVNSIKSDIEYTQAQIDKTYIKAPFSGVIGLRQVSIGAYVNPADIIATIQQMSKIKVDFTLPEEYGNIIKKGAAVDVQVDAANQQKTKAIIVATEPAADINTRNIKVRAILQSGKPNAGAFVKVFINAGENSKAILVPTNALILGDIHDQLIVVKNGKANFVNVQTGVRQASNVEITKGVNAGDSVVITGVLFARPKSNLKVRSVKTLQQLSADSTNAD